MVDHQWSSTIQVARSVVWVVQVTGAKFSVSYGDVVFEVVLNTKIMVDQWNCNLFQPPYWVSRKLRKKDMVRSTNTRCVFNSGTRLQGCWFKNEISTVFSCASAPYNYHTFFNSHVVNIIIKFKDDFINQLFLFAFSRKHKIIKITITYLVSRSNVVNFWECLFLNGRFEHCTNVSNLRKVDRAFYHRGRRILSKIGRMREPFKYQYLIGAYLKTTSNGKIVFWMLEVINNIISRIN